MSNHSRDLDIAEHVKIEKKKRSRRRKRIRTVFLFIFSLFLIISISLNAAQYVKGLQQEEKIDELVKDKENLEEIMNSGQYMSREEVEKAYGDKVSEGREGLRDEIRGMFENGDGVLKVLENVYSDKIVVPDLSGYFFFDIDDSLEKHGLDTDKFVYPEFNEELNDYEGEMIYTGEEVNVRKGVDVSKFQDDINWTKVKNDGVDFAFIRCGFRGYETGKIVEDDKFEDNIGKCNSLGIDAGVYFFSEAKSVEEGIEEAEFVLDLIKEYDAKLQLPIVIDVEQSANTSKSRTKDLTAAERTEIVKAFCERVKEAGYEPMIYGNLKSFMRMTDIYQLEGYEKWFAYYRSPLRFPYKFKIWQYTSTGSVDGIKGDVDINIMFEK